MADFLSEWQLWIKAGHVIAVMAWLAGMLYLPRLFVYHADAKAGSELSETLKIMERRLLRAIINPAMAISMILGIFMLLTPGLIDFSQLWIWIKIFCAFIGLGGMHGLLSRWGKDFEADRNTRPASFYRKMNEIPTVLMIVIVIMVIVRPF